MRDSAIAWCHHTENFWRGCTGKGCEIKRECYAVSFAKRAGWRFTTPTVTSPHIWREPFQWNAEAEAQGKFYRVFCGSLMDFFDPATDGLRPAAWEVIKGTKHLVWMVLTKLAETKKAGNGHRYFQQYADFLRATGRGPIREDLRNSYRRSTIVQLNQPRTGQDGQLTYPAGGMVLTV